MIYKRLLKLLTFIALKGKFSIADYNNFLNSNIITGTGTGEQFNFTIETNYTTQIT